MEAESVSVVAMEEAFARASQLAQAADLSGNTKVQIKLVSLCYEKGDLAELENVVNTLAKRRGLIKQAIASTIQKIMEWINGQQEKAVKLKLLALVRSVTEGKIFVEVERARATRIFAEIKEKDGQLKEATDAMQDLQVETFGSMEKREKVDFILEQIRLAILVKEFQKARIISRKVTSKTFESTDFEDLKLRYLELMISLALNDENFLECSRHYRAIADAAIIQSEPARMLAALKLAVVFVVLAKYEHAQWDQLNSIYRDKRLEGLPLYKELLRTFLTRELVRWPVVEEAFGAELRQSFPALFGTDTESAARWSQLSKRVIEHNVRTVAGYYRSISMGKFAQLIEIPHVDDAERILGRLVSERMVHAKIDRPAGLIRFEESSSPDAVLGRWNSQVNSLLSLVVKTNHQVGKEFVIHSVLNMLS